jgi:hypothetical protein
MIRRSRLTDRVLDTSRVCVVSAAQGFGATTAVADALADSRVAWVRLDAVEGADSDLWDAVAAAAGLPVSGYTVPDLAREVAGAGLAWVVLDGLDADRRSGQLDGIIRFVRLLPSEVRVVVTTSHPADALRLPAAGLTVIDRAHGLR